MPCFGDRNNKSGRGSFHEKNQSGRRRNGNDAADTGAKTGRVAGFLGDKESRADSHRAPWLRGGRGRNADRLHFWREPDQTVPLRIVQRGLCAESRRRQTGPTGGRSERAGGGQPRADRQVDTAARRVVVR